VRQSQEAGTRKPISFCKGPRVDFVLWPAEQLFRPVSLCGWEGGRRREGRAVWL